jgi:hypothetical protein
MALTVGFSLAVIGLQQLGAMMWIDPALAAWSPLMLFVPPAVGLSELLWQ